MAPQLLISSLAKTIRRAGFWIIVALFVLITIPHYAEALEHPAFIARLMTSLNLTHHSFERILYLAPIAWAGFLFGLRGAIITSLATLACMLPRAFFISLRPLEAIFESSAVFIIGNVIAVTFNTLRREREQRIQLAAVNRISSVVAQSLELNQILKSSIENVMAVMKADAVLVFLVNEENELTLAAHGGVSDEFANGVDRLKLGEGFNGMVAKTGEPMFVEDASRDPRLTRAAVTEHEIHSEIIVPLWVKEKVGGTLCVAMHSRRWFQPGEIRLLTAIGNQIGVAVENAHLYQKQLEIAVQLRASEERYRELFENAHDAIWLHDLQNNVVAANRFFVGLTGYTLEELRGIGATALITEDCIGSVEETEDRLLRGESTGNLMEVTMVREDGTEVPVQLSTNPVFSNGQIAGFQHIARDVSHEKQMQENLRFYFQQATLAQEEERKRISRELHDETIQSLVVLSRQLDALASSGKDLSEDTRFGLDELQRQADIIMQGLRRLSQDLRPAALDRLGLLAALKWLASDVEETSGVVTRVNVFGKERRLPDEVETALFRIVQEALRNVWRHAAATEAEVLVEFVEGRIRIVIKDNGKGFILPDMVGDLARDGKLGLLGMRERAQLIGGNLMVQSQPGEGSSVTVELAA